MKPAEPVYTQKGNGADGAIPEPVKLRHISEIVAEKRNPRWLISEVIEENVLAVLVGSRSTYKSFVALHWAMTIGQEGRTVIMLSGEGMGLGRRVEAWLKTHAPDCEASNVHLWAIERPMNLNAAADLKRLHAMIAEVQVRPAFVVIDTLSKFSPGLDENSNSEVAAYLSTVSREIRDRYSATVLAVAHTGHADAKRPRGAYALMANPDAEYVAHRPDPTAMTVSITRERFKDSPALKPLAYRAEVVEIGRLDDLSQPITSLALQPTEAPITRPKNRQPQGKAQRQILEALRAREKSANAPQIWTKDEMRAIGREAGQHRNTALAAADALAVSPFMVPTIGGYQLAEA